MKVLVIGSGGREHAICWKLSESPRKPILFAAPGNAGIASLATLVPIAADDIKGLLDFATQNAIDLTVVGPEQPLVLGIVDAFEEKGLKIIGPNRKASAFEGSKDFTKQFLMRHGIPTAAYETYTDLDLAMKDVGRFGFPVVIKADGLAAGKGVVIAENKVDAEKALSEMMAEKCFGASGTTVVMESFLKGTEASILCFCDGTTILPMAPAQDYKKTFDGDLGLNTGGMGTYSPSRIIDDAMMATIQTKILNPFIDGIHKDGISFKGILFVGLMIDEDIQVLEYNVRFGDPETEVILPRLENDLLAIFEAILEEKLDQVTLRWSDESAVCVIMASGGYPESYEKGFVIEGLDGPFEANVFHCGTALSGGQTLSNGGRVLGVTAMGATLEVARAKAYEAVGKIHFEKAFYRKDIGR